MKKGWKIKRLGDVCSIGDGNYSAKYPKASEFVDSGVPFLTATNLKSGTIVSDGIRYISKEQHATLKKGHILKNDLVIVVRGSSTGNNSIVQEEYEGSNLNSQLAFLRIKDNELDSKYLFSVFNSPEVQRVVLDTITGSAQPQLPNNKLLDICIPIPPLPEQKRIVATLDEAFTAIAKSKANAEQNLKNAKELFESYLQGVFENKGEGWEEITLGEMIEIKNGKNQQAVLSETGEYKIMGSAGNVMGYATDFICEAGTTIIGRKGNISKPIYINERFWNVDTAFGFYPKNEKDIDKRFVYYLCLGIDFKSMNRGTTIPSLVKSELQTIQISFPKSLKIQQTIVKKLDALIAETQKLEAIYIQKLNDLEELKKSVLHKAFSGELKTAKALV